MSIIYADNNATTRVAPEVYEAMTPFFTEDYFNPSSMYEPARRTAQAMAQARHGDRPAFRAGRSEANPVHRLCDGEQQHGDLRRGQGQSEPPAHHHHRRRASGRAGSLQGTSSGAATR